MSYFHWVQYLFTQLVYLIFRLMPRNMRALCGASLGQIVYYIGIRRTVTEQNLAAAFPHLPPKAVRQVTRRVYRHFGRVAASFATIPQTKASDFNDWIFVNNYDILTNYLAKGKGAIVVSGHLGNWELMGAIMAAKGLPVTFIVTTQRNKLIERMIDRYRESVGIEIVKRRHAVKGVLSALKRNRLVALLIDQDAHEDGAFVPFFGRLASTPRGPAVFHLKTGSPMIFAASSYLPGGRLLIELENLDTDNMTDADEITALATSKLENAIRRTPEQWFWMHRRWKTAPPKES
jgi:Kdo2-lipid IVA lauroyltransferase/acyltransferase